MSGKLLSESTLTIKKLLHKKDVGDGRLLNAIEEAIRCLTNASSHTYKSILLNVQVSVASVEEEAKESENVVDSAESVNQVHKPDKIEEEKTENVKKKRPAIISQESVSKVQKLNNNDSDSCDSTASILKELIHLEELRLSTPVKNLRVECKKTNRNKKTGNEKTTNFEIDKILHQLEVALKLQVKARRDSEEIISRKLLNLKRKIRRRNKQISNSTTAHSAKTSCGVAQHIFFDVCTGEPINKNPQNNEI